MLKLNVLYNAVYLSRSIRPNKYSKIEFEIGSKVRHSLLYIPLPFERQIQTSLRAWLCAFVNCHSLRKAVKTKRECKKHSAQNVTFQWRLMDGPCLKGPWAKSRVRFFSFQSFTIMAERVAWNDKISIEDRSWRSINFALGGPYSTCVSSHKNVSTRHTQLAWKNIHGM